MKKVRTVAIFQQNILTDRQSTVAVVPLSSTTPYNKRTCETLPKNPLTLLRIAPGPLHPTIEVPLVVLPDQIRVLAKSRIRAPVVTAFNLGEITHVSGDFHKLL